VRRMLNTCYQRLPKRGIHSMQGEKKERWMSLCEKAAQEQDPEKLMSLVQEITQLLDEKQERLKRLENANGSQVGNGQKQ
jgi:hypothetical protein